VAESLGEVVGLVDVDGFGVGVVEWLDLCLCLAGGTSGIVT
jgi:hypothetical protein